MGFEVLIIPLIAVGVWIIGTVFGPTEEPPARRPARKLGASSRNAPRTTDLDQFMEEAQRRREAGSQRREPMPMAATPLTARPNPRAEPARQQDRQPARQREVERPQARRVVQRPDQPDQPVQPGSLSPMQVANAIPMAEAVEATAAQPYQTRIKPLASMVAGEARRPLSPVMTQVFSVLRSPRSAGAAFVLQEIFGPPVSCRKRS